MEDTEDKPVTIDQPPISTDMVVEAKITEEVKPSEVAPSQGSDEIQEIVIQQEPTDPKVVELEDDLPPPDLNKGTHQNHTYEQLEESLTDIFKQVVVNRGWDQHAQELISIYSSDTKSRENLVDILKYIMLKIMVVPQA